MVKGAWYSMRVVEKTYTTDARLQGSRAPPRSYRSNTSAWNALGEGSAYSTIGTTTLCVSSDGPVVVSGVRLREVRRERALHTEPGGVNRESTSRDGAAKICVGHTRARRGGIRCHTRQAIKHPAIVCIWLGHSN